MARNISNMNTLGDIRFQNPNAVPVPQSKDYQMIPASSLIPSPFNEGMDMDRVEEYVRSMRETGLLEPIIVYDLGNGQYEILSGHMRFESWCKRLGNKDIKAVVLPYEQDSVKRFVAHTEANSVNRTLDLRFWLSRIRHAKKVLKDNGFAGSREEEIKKLSSMLNGISRAQLYRYESFEKLIPALQAFESKGWLSAMTLYAAVSLNAPQQEEVVKRVLELKAVREPKLDEMHDEFEITRDEFNKIVADVKSGAISEAKPKIKGSYSDKLGKAQIGFLKVLSNPKTEKDRDEALDMIATIRAELDRIEEQLR